MKVLKFGGTSVMNEVNIAKAIEILKSQYEGNGDYAVVVSALGGVTDLLIDMSTQAAMGDKAFTTHLDEFKKRHLTTAEGLLTGDRLTMVKEKLNKNHESLNDLLKGILLVREASPRTMDYVLSFGERNSAFIVAAACTESGIPAAFLDARKIIKTNKAFGAAKVNISITNDKVQDYFDKHTELQIVTGFVASDIGGLTTTLGRGGSDYTAALLAGALNAESLEIWTDVDSVLTSDPRKVKKAFTVKQLSYHEAMELSHFGAKVIYPPTILPALEKEIPIYIKNTFNPSFEGTVISNRAAQISNSQVTGISALQKLSLLRLQGGGMIGVPGIAARLFSALAKDKINIILITQGSSEYSISFAISDVQVKEAVEVIKEEFVKEFVSGDLQEIQIESGLSVVAIVSEKMANQPGVAGKLFSALGKEGINVIAIAQGSSELNISFVIRSNEVEKALNMIHDAFFLSTETSVNIFSIGAGLIGSTLFDQMHEAHQVIKEEQKMDLRLIGLANSKSMHFDQEGIDLLNWKTILQSSVEESDLTKFVKHIIEMNLPNSIVVDNTASNAAPEFYQELLENNISIVTPNKVASSSSFENYSKLKNTAKRKGVQFLYETNVGAGLPIISTIQNMIKSGDKIHKLEAVLSGSISYIFNTFGDGRPFSEIVTEAKSLGYTEPDPRDDLSGSDVIRKITILGRETGLPIEKSEVMLTPLLNEACLNASTVEAFFEALRKMDGDFQKDYEEAEAKDSKLRLIAKMDNGKCTVGVEAVDSSNPFYGLEKTDNMVAIYSDRYKVRPLVIKGPGAGGDVTAAGVFSEILQTGSSLINR